MIELVGVLEEFVTHKSKHILLTRQIERLWHIVSDSVEFSWNIWCADSSRYGGYHVALLGIATLSLHATICIFCLLICGLSS